MPATAVVALTEQIDRRAAVYGVRFVPGGRESVLRFAFATRVVLQAGARPGYAVAGIPLAAWDERAPAVAGVRGGPLAGLKLGTRAQAYVYADGRAHALLAGSVVNVRQDLGADEAEVTILDDRWLLEGVPVAGQFVYDPRLELAAYKERGPCRFNPDGQPNCIDAPGGPLFAPWPNFGRADGSPEPWPGQAKEEARAWRHADIVAYFIRTLATAEFAGLTAAYPYFTRVDGNLLRIPETLGAALLGDAEHAAEDARGRAGFGAADREGSSAAQRAPDLALEGWDLLSALDRVVSSAGAYALDCAPEDAEGTRSVLRIVPARYVDGVRDGLRIVRPAGGTVALHARGPSVSGGALEEDAGAVFTRVAAAGSAAALERRLAFDPESPGGGLQAGWSAADEDAFKAYVAEHPEHPNSAAAFLEAAWRWPRVFAAYQIDPNFDLHAGTKYAGVPRATAHPPLLPYLLSGVHDETSDGAKGRVFPLPIAVELRDDEDAWRARTQLDGLETDADGTLWLTGLREAGLNDAEAGTFKGTPSEPDELAPRALRVTLAVQLDKRAVAAAGLAGSSSTDVALADPNAEAAGLEPGLARTYWADADGAYTEHLRAESWPVPQSVEGSEAAEDRAAEGSELRGCGERLCAHAQRRLAELARPRKTGRLVFPGAVLWPPGAAVEALANAGSERGAYPVRGVVAKVIHEYGRGETVVELV